MVEANCFPPEQRPDIAEHFWALNAIFVFVNDRYAEILNMDLHLIACEKKESTNSECGNRFQFPQDANKLEGGPAPVLQEFYDFYFKLNDDIARKRKARYEGAELRANASYRQNQQLSEYPQTSAQFSGQQLQPSQQPFQASTIPVYQTQNHVYLRTLAAGSQVTPLPPLHAPSAPLAVRGNRSHGSDGTAAQVSADCEEHPPGMPDSYVEPVRKDLNQKESDTVIGECVLQGLAASIPIDGQTVTAAQNAIAQDLRGQQPIDVSLVGTKDVHMHGDEELDPPQVPVCSNGDLQNAPELAMHDVRPPGCRTAEGDGQMRTCALLQSNLVGEEDESSAEMQISGQPDPMKKKSSNSPLKTRKRGLDSVKQLSGGEGPVETVSVGISNPSRPKRGVSAPARRTRSAQAHSGVDGLSQQCSEGATQQNGSEVGQGKDRGSSRQVRSKRASTGAALEPESHTRKSQPSADHGTPKKSSAISELRYLDTAVISSKRSRVPPTAFTMKQMGGQNESVEEEKMMLQHATVDMNVLTPTADEVAARSQKRRKTGSGSGPGQPHQQRVRSKSVGQAAAGKAVEQRACAKADHLSVQAHKGGKGTARDAETALVGDVDMLKLPGVARLKVPAHEQPVAEACQAIPPPTDMSLVAEDFKNEGTPSVDDIHTKIAKKLQVRNAIVDASGRVGAAQVRAQRSDFRKFIQKILDNDPSLGECGSRVLRLKPTLDLDTSFFEIEMVLEALRYNYRVEALYIHNFEHGFSDTQLDTLLDLLSLGRIWACNVGENFLVSGNGWRKFHGCMPDTVLAFTYVSEAHLQRLADLKILIRAAIRLNRILSPRREPDVCKHISNMWFNPAGPIARRHYGCASVTQHDQCAANAEPLPQVVSKRKWEVESIECTKQIYGEFVQVRDKLLGSQPEQLKRRALDPRAFESRAALRSNMFSSSQPGEELRPVRVDFKTGDEADARHEDDCLHLKDPEHRNFWATHPRTRWTERSLAACMLELPEPVRALLGLSADGGPGCAEAVGSRSGTIGNNSGKNVGPNDETSGAEANRVATAETGDGSGASNSENPPLNGATIAGASNGTDDVDGAHGGAGSSSGTTRNGGTSTSAATVAAEKNQRAMIRDGEKRMTEVARGLQHLNGVKSVMVAVGSKEVQARWADPRRLSACDPYDYGNDVLAWASKCVGGNVSARRAAADGAAELIGQHIDVFLPMFVQWVGAVVESAVEGEEDVALVTFWNGGKAQLRLRQSLVTWRLSKKQQALPDGLSLQPHTSNLS